MADITQLFNDYKDTFATGCYAKMVELDMEVPYRFEGIERCERSWGVSWELIARHGLIDLNIFANG